MDLDMDIILTFLSGTQPPVSSLIRNSLATLFAFRFFTIIVTAETIWKDDLQDLLCNSTQVGCRQECYTEFSVVSPFTLFALQTVFIITLLITVAFFKSLRQPHDIPGQAACSFFSMLSRILIEGIFLFLWHMIYPGLLRQPVFKCNVIPCEQTVYCIMLGNRQKDAFSILIYICSLACILICVIEIYTLVKKVAFSKSISKIQNYRNQQAI